MSDTKTIETTNLGPVARLSIPLTPGVVVLRGRNDCGKSTTLSAVSKAMGDSRAACTCRSGARKGSFNGLGVRLSVGKNVRRTGEMEVASIEGKLNIGDLVDPGMKDAVAADTRRIRALLTLAGESPDAAKFHRLLPGGAEQFHKIVGAVEASDQVEMAIIIKQRLEAAARLAAKQEADCGCMAEACEISVEGVDLDVEADGEELQAAFEGAVERFAALDEQAKTAIKIHEEAGKASTALADAKAGYRGRTVDEASESDRLAELRREAAAAEVADREDSLSIAKRALADAEHMISLADGSLTAAKAHSDLTSRWQASIEAATGCEPPSVTDLNDAEAAKGKARQAVEAGRLARDALAKQGQAAGHRGEAEIHAAAAESLRDAARATDDVLSDAVNSETLSVVEGRLMTRTDDRGLVPYHERSEGVRCKLAIAEATKLIKRQNAFDEAVIVAPQELWQGLDPDNQRLVHEYALELGVTILTAEATNGELRAETFSGGAKGDT